MNNAATHSKFGMVRSM